MLAIRIPKELKEKMRKIQVEWSKEIRCFIEERIKQFELMETIRDAELKAEKRKAQVDSTILIRGDRER